MSKTPLKKGESSTRMDQIGIKTIEGDTAKTLIELFEKELNRLNKSDDCIKVKIDKKSGQIKISSNKGSSYAENKYTEITEWCCSVKEDVITVNKNNEDDIKKVRKHLESNAICFTESQVRNACVFRMKTRTQSLLEKYMVELNQLLERPFEKSVKGKVDGATVFEVLEGKSVDTEEEGKGSYRQNTSLRDQQAKQKQESSKDQAGSLPTGKATHVHKKPSHIESKLDVRLKYGLRFIVYVHDITSASVEAIVNPANENLSNNGGCAYIISTAAGPKFESDCKKIIKKNKRIKETENEISVPGILPFKCIINAVGPQWASYDDSHKIKCLEDLYVTIRKVLDTSEKEKIKSVAIPPVSSGIFGVPIELCAPMYVQAIVDYDFMKKKFPQEVHVVDLSNEVLDLTCKAYQLFTTDPNMIMPKAILKKYNEQVTGENASKQAKTSEKDSSQNLCRLLKHDSKKTIFEMGSEVKILIYRGDLVKLKGIGTLVSAENSAFTGNGKLAQSILRSAGSSYEKTHDQIRRELGIRRLENGSLRVSNAGKLDYRFVIHAVVGRFLESVEPQTHELLDLRLTTLRILEHANHLCTTDKKSKNLDKIAIPLLGAGALRNPRYLEILCSYVYQGIQNFFRNPRALKEVHLVSFNEETHMAFTKVFLDVSANDFQRSRDPPPTKRPLSASLRITDERRETSAPIVTWKIEEPNQDSRDFGTYFTSPMSNTEEEDCIICLTSFTNPVSLKSCHHIFCEECISEFFSQKPVCPICNTMYGKIYGDQPKNGTATIFKEKTQLPGEDCKDTWVIMYEFPDGKQGECHPNPGNSYKGTRRTAYLPVNEKGTTVLRMLERAFKQGLTFTIGFSRTTGRNNVVTWNDIHHKTRRSGGPERFGYPDPDYLERVREELEAKGITVVEEEKPGKDKK